MCDFLPFFSLHVDFFSCSLLLSIFDQALQLFQKYINHFLPRASPSFSLGSFSPSRFLLFLLRSALTRIRSVGGRGLCVSCMLTTQEGRVSSFFLSLSLTFCLFIRVFVCGGVISAHSYIPLIFLFVFMHVSYSNILLSFFFFLFDISLSYRSCLFSSFHQHTPTAQLGCVSLRRAFAHHNKNECFCSLRI